MLLTDGGRKILEIIGGEAQKQGAFANARIPNQEKLEQVIEFGLTRRGRSIHWESQMRNWIDNAWTWVLIWWISSILDWIYEGVFFAFFFFSFLFGSLEFASIRWKVEGSRKWRERIEVEECLEGYGKPV